MSIAACRFFSSLVGLHNPQVLHNLVLRTLQPSVPASSTSPFMRNTSPGPRNQKREELSLESLQPSITRFLTLFGTKFAQIAPSHTSPTPPNRTATSPVPFSSSNLGETGKSEILPPSTPIDTDNKATSSNLATPTTPNVTSSTGSSTNLSNFIPPSGAGNSGAPAEMVGGGVGYDSYLVDAQHQITIYKAACKDWSMQSAIPTQPLTYVGMFLEQIFSKLGKALDQDLDLNLILTGLIAKLCYCPALVMTMYLLSHQANVAANVPTLYGTIEKVLQDIEQRSKSFVNILACIDRARSEMAEPNPNYDHSYNKVPNTELEFNPKLFLQAVIVLEEFCKELAAILQAKIVSGLGAEKRTPLRNVQ